MPLQTACEGDRKRHNGWQGSDKLQGLCENAPGTYLIASQASHTALVPNSIAKVIGGVATLSGYWHGY